MLDFDQLERDLGAYWASLRGWQAFAASSVIVALAVALGLLIGWVLKRLIARRLTGLEGRERAQALQPLRQPLRLLLPLGLVLLVLPLLRFHPRVLGVLQHAGSLLLIALGAWLIVAGLAVAREVVLIRYRRDGEAEGLPARRFLTQFKTLQNVVNVVVITLAVAAALMTFETVRKVGVGLLASAGVTGIIVGFAAQRSIATFLAGIQIAVTQPIRLNDAVTVEGEYGVIEDIALTYVVVRLWDRRCLILPITYFIEKPFVNYTRGGTQTIGAVQLYLDHAVPVEALRAELRRVLEATPLYDGTKWELLVTKVTERTVEVRATMSAATPDAAFDLRCLVREQLVAYVAQRYPWALPTDRVETLDLRATGEGPPVRPRRD